MITGSQRATFSDHRHAQEPIAPGLPDIPLDTLAGGLTGAQGASGDLAAARHALAGSGTLRISPARGRPGLAITGGIDEYTYGILIGGLQRYRPGPGEIHVSLAGVEYCDLVGLRAIISLTGANIHGRAGRRVVLHGVPLYPKTIMRILGWESTPGLVVDDGPESGSPPRSDGAASQDPPRRAHHALKAAISTCPASTFRGPG